MKASNYAFFKGLSIFFHNRWKKAILYFNSTEVYDKYFFIHCYIVMCYVKKRICKSDKLSFFTRHMYFNFIITIIYVTYSLAIVHDAPIVIRPRMRVNNLVWIFIEITLHSWLDIFPDWLLCIRRGWASYAHAGIREHDQVSG